MSWQGTWTYIVARAADVFTASVIWKRDDVTVSSLCGLELRAGTKGDPTMQRLGRFLNRLQANHCELAIAADIARAQGAIKLLTR